MKEITALLRFFNTTYANRVKSLCEPLEQAFGIDTFWHSTIGSNGEFTHISNTPEGTCHYFDNQRYLNNPFLRHPSNYSEGFYLPTDIPEQSYMESQKKHNEKFGIDHLLFFCKPQNDFCHIFGFATSKKNLPMLTIYLNNIYLIQQFTEHFLDEVRSFPFRIFKSDCPNLSAPPFLPGTRCLPACQQSKNQAL